jgi:hypothetical protein
MPEMQMSEEGSTEDDNRPRFSTLEAPTMAAPVPPPKRNSVRESSVHEIDGDKLGRGSKPLPTPKK